MYFFSNAAEGFQVGDEQDKVAVYGENKEFYADVPD